MNNWVGPGLINNSDDPNLQGRLVYGKVVKDGVEWAVTRWIEAGGQEKVKGPPFVKHGGLCFVLLPRVRFQQPGPQLLVFAFYRACFPISCSSPVLVFSCLRLATMSSCHRSCFPKIVIKLASTTEVKLITC